MSIISLLIELVILSRPTYLTYIELINPQSTIVNSHWLLKYWIIVCATHIIMKGIPVPLIDVLCLGALAAFQYPPLLNRVWKSLNSQLPQQTNIGWFTTQYQQISNIIKSASEYWGKK